METNLNQTLLDIVERLKIYRVYHSKGLVNLRRMGKDHDGGYVVPELALEQADIILGYGISDDSSFEESISRLYGKRSYGFDGTVDFNQMTHPLFQFLPICIVSESGRQQLEGKPTKASSFTDHLQMLHIQDKKLFVKMDIEAAEYTTMPDVLKYSPQITGITFELHFDYDLSLIPKALDLLKQFEKDFLLVHVHGHNRTNLFSAPNVKGYIPRLLELSYINKNLIERFELSPNQCHPTELDMPTIPELPEAAFEICI